MTQSIKLTMDQMRKISLFQKITKVTPRDCLDDEKQDRFIKKFKLTSYEANLLVSEANISKYFEEVIKSADIKLAKNWITGDLLLF